MKGSMRQRGAESWQLRVFVGRDPVTGRKRWTTKTVRGGKREAQRALASMIAEVDRGVAVLGEPPDSAAGRAAWCALALPVEAYRDRHADASAQEDYGGVVSAIGTRPAPRWQSDQEWDGVARHLADGPAVVSVAADLGERSGARSDSAVEGLALLDDARAALDAVRSSPLCPPELLPERGLHADRGMSLGL